MTAPMSGFGSVGGRKAPPDQAARRVDLKVPDQHGRLVHVIFDRMPGAGTIQRILLFKAPWTPDMRYLEDDPESPSPIPVKLRWNYQQCLHDLQTSWNNFFGEFRTIAGRMPGVDAMAAYDAASKGRWHEVPPSLLMEIGNTPEPEDYVKAAMANNAWILGKSPVVPKWAEPLLKLKDARRRAEATGVGDDELDKYRDVSPDVAADLDDEYEAKGLSGGKVAVAPKRGARTTTRTTED